MTDASIQPFASSDAIRPANPATKAGRMGMVIILPIKKAWHLFIKVRRNQRSRRQLAELSDHLLDHIGLTEAQRQAEISKPLWNVKKPDGLCRSCRQQRFSG